jgi:hypothetical protein
VPQLRVDQHRRNGLEPVPQDRSIVHRPDARRVPALPVDGMDSVGRMQRLRSAEVGLEGGRLAHRSARREGGVGQAIVVDPSFRQSPALDGTPVREEIRHQHRPAVTAPSLVGTELGRRAAIGSAPVRVEVWDRKDSTIHSPPLDQKRRRLGLRHRARLRRGVPHRTNDLPRFDGLEQERAPETVGLCLQHGILKWTGNDGVQVRPVGPRPHEQLQAIELSQPHVDDQNFRLVARPEPLAVLKRRSFEDCAALLTQGLGKHTPHLRIGIDEQDGRRGTVTALIEWESHQVCLTKIDLFEKYRISQTFVFQVTDQEICSDSRFGSPPVAQHSRKRPLYNDLAEAEICLPLLATCLQ